MKSFKTNPILVVPCAIWAFGCGAAALPNESLTSAKEAVSAAEAVGAKDEPQADLHLKMAEDGIVEAEKLIAEKRTEEAIPRLERAIADAELARELTNEAEKQRLAEVALERLRNIEQGSETRGNGS